VGSKWVGGFIAALVVFILVLTISTTIITGTDTASMLLKVLGPLIAGFVALGVGIRAMMNAFSGKGE
jgi:hypothetical protein